MRRKFSIIFLLIIAILVGIVFLEKETLTKQVENSSFVEENHLYKTGIVKVGGIDVKVDLATTPVERSRGLSGREGLISGTGMFFVFEISGQYGFWMKDMLFPIDIIWINQEKKIIHIEKNLSPDTYPTIFTSEQDAKYVLEVPAGFSDQQKIKVGNSLEILL